MHIEVDAWEWICIIGAWMAFKWLFRILALIIVGKVAGAAKKKAADSLNDIKKKVQL